VTLTGYDISNVNGAGIITRALGGQFIICKRTEGLGFVDGLHDGFVAAALGHGIGCTGSYHFAHVANGGAQEADVFLRYTQLRKGHVLVLDFEPYGQNVPDSAFPGYICAFMQRVLDRTGIRPWIYLNDDMGARIARQASPAQMGFIRSFPLWKARYTSNPGSAMGWPAVTCWQSQGTGIDVDVFYGNPADWHALSLPGGHGPTSSAGSSIPNIPTTATVPPQQGADMPLNDADFAALEPHVRKWVSEEVSKDSVSQGFAGAADQSRILAAIAGANIRFIAQDANTPAVFVGDGIVRTHIPNAQALIDKRYVLAKAGYTVHEMGRIADLDAIGVLIGEPPPAEAPEVEPPDAATPPVAAAAATP